MAGVGSCPLIPHLLSAMTPSSPCTGLNRPHQLPAHFLSITLKTALGEGSAGQDYAVPVWRTSE